MTYEQFLQFVLAWIACDEQAARELFVISLATITGGDEYADHITRKYFGM